MSRSVWSRLLLWLFVGLAWLAAALAEAQGVKPSEAQVKKPPMQSPAGNPAHSDVLAGSAQQAAQEAGPPPKIAFAGPAEDYLDAQLRVVQCLESQLDPLADTADAAAARLQAGGRILLAGEHGMILELTGRAGGLCAAKPVPPGKNASPPGTSDVVLLSDFGITRQPTIDFWTPLVQSDALVVAFTSAENPRLKQPLPGHVRPVPLAIQLDSRLIAQPNGQRLIPTASPAVAAAQWAFVAELIGACRRQNRQLAVYLSFFLDPDRQRYKRTAGLLFEPDLRPDPVARKHYAGQFLATVRGSLEAVRREEIPQIRKAAGWLAEASAARVQVVRNLTGHLPPAEIGAPGDVDFFTNLKSNRPKWPEGEAWIRQNIHSGDVYLLLGYQENEDTMAAAAHERGARTIFITSRGPGAEQRKDPRHVYVDPHWPYTDACLELPGYDVKACPISGIMGLSCYYAICGEAVERMTHLGK